MNEFTAKKLGEVLAFATVGIETWEKGREALESVFGEDTDRLIDASKKHRDTLGEIAGSENVQDIVSKKLERTGSKLRSMRDMYVGDEWDNPTELLEWSGFFEGAAIVHWHLVKGAAEAVEHGALSSLADEALSTHEEIFKRAGELLHKTGKERGAVA